MVHILPLLATLMLSEHKHRVQSSLQPETVAAVPSESSASYHGIMGLLHAIPSNHDVTLILNSALTLYVCFLVCFLGVQIDGSRYSCLYTTGRMIVIFIERMMKCQRFIIANRYRSDLEYVQGGEYRILVRLTI
jgi:hypothetical protein